MAKVSCSDPGSKDGASNGLSGHFRKSLIGKLACPQHESQVGLRDIVLLLQRSRMAIDS